MKEMWQGDKNCDDICQLIVTTRKKKHEKNTKTVNKSLIICIAFDNYSNSHNIYDL